MQQFRTGVKKDDLQNNSSKLIKFCLYIEQLLDERRNQVKQFGIVFAAVIIYLSTACNDSSYPFDVVEGSVDIGYTLDSAGTVDVIVTDSFMGLVRTLVDSQTQDAGAHSVEWDLTDDDGNYPENGLYNVEVYLNGDRIEVQVLEVNRQ